MVVDSPGFRNPSHCGRSTGATFEDLCHNYVQERLQLLFHDTVFTSKQDLYAQVCGFLVLILISFNLYFSFYFLYNTCILEMILGFTMFYVALIYVCVLIGD